jgi:hypothetical protein
MARPPHLGPTRKQLAQWESQRGKPVANSGERRKAFFSNYQGLDEEARSALNLCGKMRKRLSYEAHKLEQKEALENVPKYSSGLLSTEWAQQLRMYWATLEGILREHRKYQEIQMAIDGVGLELSPDEESEELIRAAAQLSDDELRRAIAMRTQLMEDHLAAIKQEAMEVS